MVNGKLINILNSRSALIVFILSLLSRIPNLGYDFINSDAFLWKQRGYEFTNAITSLHFGDTLVTYHPGISLLYNLLVANKIFGILDEIMFHGSLTPNQDFFVNHTIQKFVIAVFTSILITIIFVLLKKLVSAYKSYLFVALLLLEPFFIGLSRAVHTDVIEALTIFISLLSFYIILQRKKGVSVNNVFLLSSGFFLGLSILTKSSALILPFFYLLYVIFLYVFRKENKFKLLLGVYLISVVVFIILWPVMLVNPMEALYEYFIKGIKGIGIEEGHGHIWFGQITQDPGLIFYPIAVLARYSVEIVYLFILFILFALLNFKKVFKIDKLSFYTAGFVFLYLMILTFSSKKLDRYTLVLLPNIILLSILYIDHYFTKKFVYIALIIVIIMRAYLFYSLTPNYLAYYSPLIGGVRDGVYLIEPKWPVGYDKIAGYFNTKENAKDIKVAIADQDYLRPFGIFETLNIKHDTAAAKADYIVLPVYRESRNEYYANKYLLEKHDEEITIAGVPFYLVYKLGTH